MDGADPARMAGAPGFKEVESFGPAHLADRDAIRAQAQRRTHQIGERRHAILGAHRDQIGRGALQFARVFNDHDAVRSLGDFCQQRVGQRGFAGRGAARDKDIGARGDVQAQHLGLSTGHDPGVYIVVEREHRDGRLADGKGGAATTGGSRPFEPLAGLGQFSRDTRMRA
jgi:hypothetical protein